MIRRRNGKGKIVEFSERALVPLKAIKFQEQSVITDGDLVFKETVVMMWFVGHEHLTMGQPICCN